MNNSARLAKVMVNRGTSLRRFSRFRFLIIPFVIGAGSFGPLPAARAQCPQGCDTNTYFGSDTAFQYNTSGSGNCGFGNSIFYYNTTGSLNVALGDSTLFNNTTGSGNIAIGFLTLVRNTTGNNNTAVGSQTLGYNQNGTSNTAIGVLALYNNTIGSYNTAVGNNALFNNDYAWGNTAVGDGALLGNVSGYYNTAAGEYALSSNTSGSYNVAGGVSALQSNTTGGGNTATGSSALLSNSTGGTNCAYGDDALSRNTTASNNTSVGFNSLSNNTTGGSNIALGESAGINLTTGSNNIDIGNKGVAGEANTIRIGKKGTQTTTVIAGIRGTTVAGGIGVLIDASGRLGTATSSARFKQNIQAMDKASEAILALKPVTFRYKHELDPDGIPQFGLVAEQVEKVDPDLVARDDQGKPYTVRYEAVNAMLLNEFLKEHRTVEELKSTVAKQQEEISELIAAIKEHRHNVRY